VLICSCCDRGNIYCGEGCAGETGATRNARPDSVINQPTVVVSDTLRERHRLAALEEKYSIDASPG
jgi:hypothetical protein